MERLDIFNKDHIRLLRLVLISSQARSYQSIESDKTRVILLSSNNQLKGIGVYLLVARAKLQKRNLSQLAFQAQLKPNQF